MGERDVATLNAKLDDIEIKSMILVELYKYPKLLMVKIL